MPVTTPFQGYDPRNEYGPMMGLIIEIETYQADAMGEWLLGKLNPESVIDVGCGPGSYLSPFKQAGCEVYGIDACPTAGELLAPGEFERVDLRFPFVPKHRFDMSLCIEVVEHLHEEYAGVLVDTLASCSDIVVFTAAVPGQGGTQHFNEKEYGYWLNLFAERGFGVHPLQDELKAFLETLSGQCQPWLKSNIFILEKHS